MEKLKAVDAYILKHEKWSQELSLLRDVILSTGLIETYKWSSPVYVKNKKNIVGLGAFKNHMGLWFFNGSLLKDSEKRLHNAQEGKTTAMRQWRFLNFEDVVENVEVIEQYVQEAKLNWDKVNTVSPKVRKPLIIPVILENAFSDDAFLRDAFNSLNLTKKREYIAHINSAKRDATKQSRLEKIMPLIKEGAGLNDKYRK
ncbi:MAG: YdeI/OmpD-associated family protein [Salibacteraceae bacterium]